jgi:hypothetical protein
VDALEGRCTCPNKQKDLEDGDLCKHIRRIRFVTGQRAIPTWADTDEVDVKLEEHVNGIPKVTATDSCVTIEPKLATS